MKFIPFNQPYFSGSETDYIKDAVLSGKISGDGAYTKKCHSFFENRYKFRKALLTTSCSDALEMTALLLNSKEGDEVIMPSYTFVSTANAFVIRGAKPIFVDSRLDHPGMDESLIESLITPKTIAIVVVHYAGVACDMDIIMDIANRYGLVVIEDAAQAIDSFYKGQALGSIGHLAAFSFHETKNVISGEGGMLVINDSKYIERAEIIREKGTNRTKFFRGEIDKYNWIDIGSSFLPSDITAAFLYAQLENIDAIQEKRKLLWNTYMEELSVLSDIIQLPNIPNYANHNSHIFYFICRSLAERDDLINYLKSNEISSVFHYQSLQKSPYYLSRFPRVKQPNTDKYSDCLLRLPMYFNLDISDIKSRIAFFIKKYYETH